MIAIFDYGAGNLRSVENTLAAIGTRYELVREAEGLRRAEKIILPGVGHFGQLIRSLDSLGVRETFRERIGAGVPFLGICLGLQALFESSEEAPELAGLGRLPREGPSLSNGDAGAAYGLEQLRVARSTAPLQGPFKRPLCVFRPQLLCSGYRCRRPRGGLV